MSLFRQMKPAEIQRYTHYARFAGLVPCYFNEYTNELAVRNWLPDWLLDAATWLYGSFVTVVTMVDEDYEPEWMLVITGEILKGSKK